MEGTKDNPMWGAASSHRDDDSTQDCGLNAAAAMGNTVVVMVDPDSCWASSSICNDSCLSFSDFFVNNNILTENDLSTPSPSKNESKAAAGISSDHAPTFSAIKCDRLSAGGPPKVSISIIGNNSNYYNNATPASTNHFTTNGISRSLPLLNSSALRTVEIGQPKNPNDVIVRHNGLSSRDDDVIIASNISDVIVNGVRKKVARFNEKNFPCEQCDAAFTRSYALKRHVITKHSLLAQQQQQQPLKHCPFFDCTYTTRKSNLMQMHKRWHQKATIYYCKQCKVRYSLRSSLLLHLTQKHNSDTSLIGMLLMNTPPPAATSDDENESENVFELTCKKSLKIDDTLQQVVDSSKNFTINQLNGDSKAISCAKPNNKFDANDHPSFLCTKCDYSSDNFLDIYRHRQSAHGSANSHVDQNSRKNPSSSSSNICLYCFQRFASSNNLLSHIKKKHLQAAKSVTAKKKVYSCCKCPFTTTRKKVLKAHEENSRHGNYTEHQKQNIGSNDEHCSQRTPNVGQGVSSYTPRSSSLIGCSKDGGFHEGVPMSAASSSWGSRNTTSVEQRSLRGEKAFDQSYDEVGVVYEFSTNQSMQQRLTGVGHQIDTLNDEQAATALDMISQEPQPHIFMAQAENEYDNNMAGGANDNFIASTDDSFDEMAACVQNLQAANHNLLCLSRRRSDQLTSLRHNVLELLKRVHPSSECFSVARRGPAALHEVDRLVIDAINCGFRTNDA